MLLDRFSERPVPDKILVGTTNEPSCSLPFSSCILLAIVRSIGKILRNFEDSDFISW